MLDNIKKKTNITANSIIEGANGAIHTVVYLDATVYENEEVSINQTIRNARLYTEHQQQVEEDFGKFRSEVIKNINGQG